VLGPPRLHHTIATGEVISKEAAGEYALDVFPFRGPAIVQLRASRHCSPIVDVRAQDGSVVVSDGSGPLSVDGSVTLAPSQYYAQDVLLTMSDSNTTSDTETFGPLGTGLVIQNVSVFFQTFPDPAYCSVTVLGAGAARIMAPLSQPADGPYWVGQEVTAVHVPPGAQFAVTCTLSEPPPALGGGSGARVSISGVVTPTDAADRAGWRRTLSPCASVNAVSIGALPARRILKVRLSTTG
jgi:hypothetical protein